MTLTLKNAGALAHNAKLFRGGREIGGSPTFPGGRTESGRVRLERGSYEMVCTVGDHAARGMVGIVTVRSRPRGSVTQSFRFEKRSSVPSAAGLKIHLVHEQAHELEAAPGLGQVPAAGDARAEAAGVGHLEHERAGLLGRH